MRYTSKLLCTIALLLVSTVAHPCGPFYFTKDNVQFFRVSEETTASGDRTKNENLRLWQRETSADIPLADIEEIVYGDFGAETWEESEVSDTIRANKFYRWIRGHKAVDVEDFLTLAKRVERMRAEKCSPWYYPAHKATDAGIDDGYASLIERCSDCCGSRLKTRYGLQLIRLLHASCQYEECVAAYNRWFDNVPDGHLMKRMAMSYVAGAWTRLGDVDKANRYFALNGDVNSLNGVNVIEYMADINPSAYPMKRMEELIMNPLNGYLYSDNDTGLRFLLTMAHKVINEGKASNMGEWEFLAAYLEGLCKDYQAAHKYIHDALAHGLRTQTGRDHARAYRMAIDGILGNPESLLADLKWIEGMVENSEEDFRHWQFIMLNVVYGYWYPYLVEHNRQPMAILLGNYVENVCASNYYRLLSAEEKEQMRSSREVFNKIDFGGRFIEYAMTLKPQDLIDYKNCLSDKSKLVAYLRDGGRNDDDYLNEIIGTLYLQQCNYAGAIHYLSKVSPEYQYTLNTYKEDCLTRDPFAFTFASRKNMEESVKMFSKLQCKENIKLTFAKEMYRLEQEMQYGESDGIRTIATAKYTLARYASFTTCWALTAYAKGFTYYNHDVYPDIYDTNEEVFPGRYDPIDLQIQRKKKETERMKRVMAGMVAATHDDETTAELQYMLGNLKTVAKHYADTAIGRRLSAHCDNWKDWI